MQARPILKWPGGKSWVAERLSGILARELQRTYYEPFLGGAAVCIALDPECAVLSDTNSELIDFYNCVVANPERVVAAARRFRNTADEYYRVRASCPRTDIGRAGRFLYLNKTCWGGIYRINKVGSFNVPYGQGGRKICCEADIHNFALTSRGFTFVSRDFEDSFDEAVKGDVLFADPPYTSKGQFNGFLRYNEKLFSWSDQERLASYSHKAKRKGVFVAVCGSYHRDFLALYEGWWVAPLQRNSLVASRVSARREIWECILFSRFPTSNVLSVNRINCDLLLSIPHHD
jgi:DNA adenine methylase